MDVPKKRLPIRVIDFLVIGSIAVGGFFAYRQEPTKTGETVSEFSRQIDLKPIYKLAVQADGRLRSFESHAKTFMGYISGSRLIKGQSNGYSYLDLMFRPEAYTDADMIFVKNKDVRAQLLDAAKAHTPIDETRYESIMKSGLFSRPMLNIPAVAAILQELGKDLIRTSKVVDMIQGGMNASDPRVLSSNLRLIAPPSGDINVPWSPMSELVSDAGMPRDNVHAGMTPPARGIPGLPTELSTQISDAWKEFQGAWRSQDAAATNASIHKLAELLPTVAPTLYPSAERLGMESWYFRYKSMTWVWLFYLACTVPLLMSIIYSWDGARKIGMWLFVLAFLAHTASVAVRWYISGRWPNANMFEAVTTAAWFGGVAAIVLERLVRNSPFRNLFALGSAVMSMMALMAAYFLPAQLDSSINNKMAALNDIWLYIHTNVIIWSYAVIGLACIPALLLLRHRWIKAWDEGTIPGMRLLILPAAVVILNYTAYRLLMLAIDPVVFAMPKPTFAAMTGAFSGSLMIIVLEVMAARARRLSGAIVERAASGGASALMLGGGGGSNFMRQDRPTVTQVYDGATMVLVELSFVMLWAGLVMGAIWADHSWGRPWGWDPKEVFALNTFIIFLILIHVRLKVKDKAFWTAVIAVIGFEVMMFNWIVVNFIITGLHSYA